MENEKTNKPQIIRIEEKSSAGRVVLIILMIIIALALIAEIAWFMISTFILNKESGNGPINENLTDNKVLEAVPNGCEAPEKTSFNVIFNAGTNHNPEDIVVEAGKATDALLPTPTNNDKIFIGWFYDDRYTNPVESKLVTDLKTNAWKDGNGCPVEYNNVHLFAKWQNPDVSTDEKFYAKMEEIMTTRDYDEYLVSLLRPILPKYKELYTNEELYAIFDKIDKMELSDDGTSWSDRTTVHIGCGVKNCANKETNRSGYTYLLAHEINHSVGGYGHLYEIESFDIPLYLYNYPGFIEEGMGDVLGDYMSGSDGRIKHDEYGQMYYDTLTSISAGYRLSDAYVYTFVDVGCFSEIIHAEIASDYSGMKACMAKNVENGESYFEKLITLYSKMFLFIEYPATFPSKEELTEKYAKFNNVELNEFIKSRSLVGDLIIEYRDLIEEILAHRK